MLQTIVPIIIPTEDSGAKDAHCRLVMRDYNPGTATVGDRRDYAACVQRLDGSGTPMPVELLVFFKVMVGLSLAGLVIGAWKGWTEDDLAGVLAYGFLGAVVGPAFLVAIGLMVAGVAFLFGG